MPSLKSVHASSQRRHPTQRLGSETIMPRALATKTCRGALLRSGAASAPQNTERGYAQSEGTRDLQKLSPGDVLADKLRHLSGNEIFSPFSETALFMSVISILLFEL